MPQGLQHPDQVRAFIFVSYQRIIPPEYPTRLQALTSPSLDAMLYSEESFGNLALARGGKNGYERVRGGQGTRHDKWQGYTKGKKKTTELYDTAEEAAVALARLEQDLTLGLIELEDKKPRKKRKTSGAPTPARPARPPARLPFDCLHSRAHRTSQARQSCPSRRRRWSSTRPRSIGTWHRAHRRCPCSGGPPPRRRPRSACGSCRPSRRPRRSRTRASRSQRCCSASREHPISPGGFRHHPCVRLPRPASYCECGLYLRLGAAPPETRGIMYWDNGGG